MSLIDFASSGVETIRPRDGFGSIGGHPPFAAGNYEREASEFCARHGWSAEKYRKVAQRARAKLRVRGVERRVRLHADLTILAKLSCTLARARAVPLAA
jgi:hypothetical protein